MVKLEKRKVYIAGALALVITFLHVAGWQISMDYGSSFFQSAFWRNIGVLEPWQCVLWGVVEVLLLGPLFCALFSCLERRESKFFGMDSEWQIPRAFWPISFLALFLIWMVFLWGCYPGYYNYDIGNQLPQVLYKEVQYDAHHPLLHTLLCGGIITLGYRIDSTDLTLGVFMYNAFQMLVAAACLSYTLRFVYQRTRSKALLIFSFVFYALCPPVVMLAMSPTKDVLCFCMLLMGFLKLVELLEGLQAEEKVSWKKWIQAGIFLALSCLLRKNISYAVAAFAVLSLLLVRRERKKQLILYLSVLLVYYIVDKGLLLALDAIPGAFSEALSIPFQQMARLYVEEGGTAFTEKEYELLAALLPPDALHCYDPAMADYTKSNFYGGFDVMMANKWEYLWLWIKKGLEYPGVYLEALLYNTYQAWYPWTTVQEYIQVRYFMITDWQYEYGRTHWQGLFRFYEAVSRGEYAKYPVLRLFLSTGTMFWGLIIAWFYSIWRKRRSAVVALLLIFMVCVTNFLGPVSDVRYYLILFYLLPVCLGFLLQRERKK